MRAVVLRLTTEELHLIKRLNKASKSTSITPNRNPASCSYFWASSRSNILPWTSQQSLPTLRPPKKWKRSSNTTNNLSLTLWSANKWLWPTKNLSISSKCSNYGTNLTPKSPCSNWSLMAKKSHSICTQCTYGAPILWDSQWKNISEWWPKRLSMIKIKLKKSKMSCLRWSFQGLTRNCPPTKITVYYWEHFTISIW